MGTKMSPNKVKRRSGEGLVDCKLFLRTLESFLKIINFKRKITQYKNLLGVPQSSGLPFWCSTEINQSLPVGNFTICRMRIPKNVKIPAIFKRGCKRPPSKPIVRKTFTLNTLKMFNFEKFTCRAMSCKCISVAVRPS